ncbi:hypothetical protein BSR29_05250 [Boudabousia liubingyangii]|uniref:Uncharacterized protein n=1 Tax=Boudabousia liubingyangii TaxID=1921764 RepID=A0A1Q5PLG1_9ACTO|nr:hypothetical protein [Boudabousia liubingyangii]OKL47895.1 hypothetical protein BSR29_05250 [Boudabousia liubingyangii]
MEENQNQTNPELTNTAVIGTQAALSEPETGYQTVPPTVGSNGSFAADVDSDPVAVDAPKAKLPLLNILTIVLSSVWLIASVVGSVMIFSAEEVDDSPVSRISQTVIEPESQHAFYGGDAYTGIQQAASDTEHTVATSANAIQKVNLDIVAWQTRTQSKALAIANRPTQLGLGFVVLGLGIVPFLFSLNSLASVIARTKNGLTSTNAPAL